MDAATFFYLSLGIAIWVLIGAVAFIVFQVYKTLTIVRTILESTKGIANGLKIGSLTSAFSFYSIADKLMKGFLSRSLFSKERTNSNGGDKYA